MSYNDTPKIRAYEGFSFIRSCFRLMLYFSTREALCQMQILHRILPQTSAADLLLSAFFFSSPAIFKITLPLFIMIRRLPCAIASRILWVTIMAVRWFSVMILSVRASTFAAVFGSSAAVCSSRSSTFGFLQTCHQKGNCLSLSAGKQPDLRSHTILQSQIQFL